MAGDGQGDNGRSGPGAPCGAAGWLFAAAAPQAGRCAAGRSAGSCRAARPDGRWPPPWCAPGPAGPGPAGPGPARTSAHGVTDRPSRARPGQGSRHISELPGEPCQKAFCVHSANNMAHSGKINGDYLPSCRAYRYPVADRLRKGAGGVRNLCPRALYQGVPAPFVTRANNLILGHHAVSPHLRGGAERSVRRSGGGSGTLYG